MLAKIVGPVNSRLIFAFVISNVLAILFVLGIPAKADTQNFLEVVLLNVVFTVGITLFAIVIYASLSKFRNLSECPRSETSSITLTSNIWILTAFPILGIVLLLYDRILIRGINYLDGLRAARYEWMATEGGGIIGITGNLLVPFSYVALFVLVRQGSRLSGIKYYSLLLSSAVGVFGHSALNGGRSNLFLAIVLVIIGFLINSKDEKAKKPKFRYLVNAFIFICCIFYIAAIMKSSAVLGGVDLGFIAEHGIIEMYGIPDVDFFKLDHSNLTYFLLYSLTYLYHGQWTAQIIMEMAHRPGYHSLVSAPTVFLDQLGLIDLGLSERYFSDTGAFISLPGSIYYDFGIFGILVAILILGLCFGISMIFLSNNKEIRSIRMIFSIAVICILLLSPILPAYGFAYYSFIIFAFSAFSAINYFVFWRKIKY